MKKVLVGILILTLNFGVVGCGNKKNSLPNTGAISQEENEKDKKRSSDEMYELYTSKLDEVEKLFKENNIDFKEKKREKNKKYDGKVSIVYENSNEDAKFSVAGYGIAFEDTGEIKYISAEITLNVKDDEVKNKEFKFEDTEFYKLHNILISDIKNKDEINKKVNDAYKDLTSLKKIEIENGNVKEKIILGDNRIDYAIIINP